MRPFTFRSATQSGSFSSTTRERFLVACSCVATFLLTSLARAQAPREQPDTQGGASAVSPPTESAPLPPVPFNELRAKSPQPSWDIGLLAAGCGVGSRRAFETTRFCGGGLADVIFLRQKETEAGLGAYGQISTAGFVDARISAGVSAIVSLVDWFTLGLRAGGLVATTFRHSSPGAEAFLEFGHRSVSFRSHYSVSHALFAGLQLIGPRGEDPRTHAIWFGLRVDGLWLTAPRAFFR